MEWAAQQGADIVNMSFGGYDTEEVDPIEQAVESLSAQHGILFVVAAGNSGGSGTSQRERRRRSIRGSSKPTSRAAVATVAPWLIRCSARSTRSSC